MRTVLNCGDLTGGTCSFSVAGEEDQVLQAALQHGAAVHGLSDTPDVRAAITGGMQRAAGATVRGYGTTMIGKLAAGSRDDIVASLEQWEEERHAPGFLGAQLLVADDGTIVNTAVFTDAQAYDRLANDPAQDEWYRTRIAPFLDGDPQWIDGEWDVFVRRPAITLPEQATPRQRATT
jgi:predicted small metal-binding protein